jgi:hypothetical protein
MARVVPEKLYKFREPWMICFQTAQLMRLKGKKGCLHAGKQRGTENQNRNDHQQDGQGGSCHFLWRHSQDDSLTARGGQSRSPEKLVHVGLPII